MGDLHENGALRQFMGEQKQGNRSKGFYFVKPPPLDLATAGAQFGSGGFTNSWKGGQPHTVPHIHCHLDVKETFYCYLFWDFGLFPDMFGLLEINYPG